MLINHDREKLIQAINFFVRNTRKCGKVKLFKLLYFLDFEHFKATGRSVTGLEYYAWPMGPVPVSLKEEIDAPKPDMAEALRFEEQPIRHGTQTMLVVKPQVPFSDRHFSKREMSILRDLAGEYQDADADQMVEATHLENLPWSKVYEVEGRRQALIPYRLAVRPDEVEAVMRVADEHREIMERLG